MRKGLALVLVAAGAAVSLAACGGSDEAADNGQIINGGGQGGAAGSAGGVGTSGSSGSATAGSGGGTAPGTATLGARCIAGNECAEGLLCLGIESTELGGSAPGGLCTATCVDHDACNAISPGAFCVTFDGGDFCLEGCAPDSPPPKCHDRPEFICRDLATIPGTTPCTSAADCTEPGTLCGANDTCDLAVTGCVPMCGGDSDCAPGTFCDPYTGLCGPTAPVGKTFNEPCDPGPTGDPLECAGFCLASYDDPTVGKCSGFCNLVHPYACGFNGEGAVADAACMFPTVLAGETPESGDLGFCGPLCDCNSDCATAGEYCNPWPATVAADYQAHFLRDGYCMPIIDGGTFTPADSLDCGMGVGGAGPVPPAGGAGGDVAAGGAGGTP